MTAVVLRGLASAHVLLRKALVEAFNTAGCKAKIMTFLGRCIVTYFICSFSADSRIQRSKNGCPEYDLFIVNVAFDVEINHLIAIGSRNPTKNCTVCKKYKPEVQSVCV